ncbi:hypothetical protein [Oligoflexus tunisiensis]|uniref:hypothetical protein n=1 Tax=Oligoflexus tunisiensis TaxID=708132 RepID=UPI001C407EC2|nr:hypothetical protein [Oligoflexus tunisiensis]
MAADDPEGRQLHDIKTLAGSRMTIFVIMGSCIISIEEAGIYRLLLISILSLEALV